jgi:integrase/recombinase XerD
MLLGGLRISEIATCRPYQDGVKVIGKGSRERYVPIPVWLLEAMRRMNKKGRGGWGVSRQKIGSVLSRTQGIRNPHRLRHTYASELIRRGYRIEQVQKLLGHEDIKTTTVYARVEVPPDVCDRLGM